MPIKLYNPFETQRYCMIKVNLIRSSVSKPDAGRVNRYFDSKAFQARDVKRTHATVYAAFVFAGLLWILCAKHFII